MNNKIRIFLTAGAAAAALVSCKMSGNGAPVAQGQQAEVAEQLPTVAVATSVIETVAQDAVYSATVQANIVNNIAPQTAGRIKKLNVEIGDFVNAGQILAEMDKLQLQQAELRLKNEEAELARVRTLYEEGGVSQSDFEQLELSHKVNTTTYNNLLENTVLRSPITGVVTARNYDKGDLYGMAQPIYTVQQITPVKVLVGISESDYTKVAKGDKVEISADALPGKTFTGSVVRLYPIMDAATHTFSVEVRISNEKRELRPGMYARVKVNFGANRSVVIPDAAVIKQQGSGQRSVYVVTDGNVVELRNVTPGRHFDGKYEILSGLEEGETVVTKGQTALRAGAKVEII